MDIQLSRKDVNNEKIVLLRNNSIKGYLTKIGYNCGVYGWNWSIYSCKGTDVLFVDGYRNFPKNAEVNEEVETFTKELIDGKYQNISWSEKQDFINKKLAKIVNE